MLHYWQREIENLKKLILSLRAIVEEQIQRHRRHRRQQDAGFEQRVQPVRQLLEEIRRDQRDHAEADRHRDNVEIVAVALEVDAGEDARQHARL